MADLYGSPLGEIAYNTDQLTRANTAHTLGQIAVQPFEQRKRAAEAERLELEMVNERKMAQLMEISMRGGAQGDAAGAAVEGGMQGGGFSPAAPRSMADQLDNLSRMAAGAGMITKASALAKDAALIRSRESAAANSSAGRAKNILDAQRAQATLTGQLLGNPDITDDASWERANQLYRFQTGQPSPYANVPYSPALVRSIRDNALTVKEELDEEGKRVTQLNLKAFRDRRLEQHDAAQEIREANAAIAKAREERLAKAGGGKGVSGPAAGEVKQAKAMLQRDFPELEGLNDAAYSIAADARAIRRSNPAIDAATALQQALNSAREAGDFGETTGMMGFRKKPLYSGAGKTPETAAVYSGPADAAKLRVGRYYRNKNGVLAKWTGKGFEQIARGLSSNNDRLDPDEDEDLDEDIE